jgi:hypothetical protein
MTSTEFVYTAYIKTTPEKVCAAITTSEFTRQYWALKSSPIATSRAGSSGIVGMYSFLAVATVSRFFHPTHSRYGCCRARSGPKQTVSLHVTDSSAIA